jgi:hypothetical protein
MQLTEGTLGHAKHGTLRAEGESERIEGWGEEGTLKIQLIVTIPEVVLQITIPTQILYQKLKTAK